MQTWASNLHPPMSEGDLISAFISHCSVHVKENMIGRNLKNIQEALHYLSKRGALDSQNGFTRDRSSPNHRDYNQGPQNPQAAEQNDVRRRADVQIHQTYYSGGGLFNRNGRVQRSPRAYRERNSNGCRRTTVLAISKDETWILEQMGSNRLM
jgi:hypothetical protein